MIRPRHCGTLGKGAVVVLATACLAVPARSIAAQVAMSRFFASPRQCESAGALAPGACRTAFANALAEYAAKVPTYRSRRACIRAFGPCMPWPIGTHRFSEFRPQWIGVTIGPDLTVAPAVAPGRVSFAFAPQPTAALSNAAAAAPAPFGTGEGAPPASIMTPDDDGEGAGGGAAPQAGGGFTVIDGVLTYPAPARFQPRAARHP